MRSIFVVAIAVLMLVVVIYNGHPDPETQKIIDTLESQGVYNIDTYDSSGRTVVYGNIQYSGQIPMGVKVIDGQSYLCGKYDGMCDTKENACVAINDKISSLEAASVKTYDSSAPKFLRGGSTNLGERYGFDMWLDPPLFMGGMPSGYAWEITWKSPAVKITEIAKKHTYYSEILPHDCATWPLLHMRWF